MISKALDVDSYVAEVPEERRSAIEKLRRLCRRHLKGYEECIEYGMAAYKRGGTVEVAFASQKQYVSLYILKKEVLDEFRGEFPGIKAGKGCLRFARPERIDFQVVERLLIRNAQSEGSPC